MQEIEAYSYCQETIGLKLTVEKNYLVLCRRLHKIREERLYEANFGQWDLFLDEMGLNKRKADAMIKIYERFILELGVEEEMVALAGGWSVAETLLPIAINKEEAEEGLEFARHALRKDVRMYVNDKLGKTPEGICSHEETYHVTVCRDCRERWEEHREKDEIK